MHTVHRAWCTYTIYRWALYPNAHAFSWLMNLMTHTNKKNECFSPFSVYLYTTTVFVCNHCERITIYYTAIHILRICMKICEDDLIKYNSLETLILSQLWRPFCRTSPNPYTCLCVCLLVRWVKVRPKTLGNVWLNSLSHNGFSWWSHRNNIHTYAGCWHAASQFISIKPMCR